LEDSLAEEAIRRLCRSRSNINQATEDSIANDFVVAGIFKDKILLGFHLPDIRPYIEFAVQ
jgi:hypothetical protein